MPGGKIGGVADVVRDLPAALVEQGLRPLIITPSYGTLHQLPGATKMSALDVTFAGSTHSVDLYQVPGIDNGVANVVVEHANLQPTEPGVVYHSLENEGPYATDASKFAFFCACVATWIEQLPSAPKTVHLHDWHAAFYLLLRAYDPKFAKLQSIQTVYTIHNLSYQGQRPLDHHQSSLAAWYHDLPVVMDEICDPRARDCLNPMKAAIRLADRINTVSPTYAREIMLPSDRSRGFIGGEGLEDELAMAATDGRLVGILNGCYYSARQGRGPGWAAIKAQVGDAVDRWHKAKPAIDHELAQARIDSLPARRRKHILVSIGRLVEQKASLFVQPLQDGRTALEHVLDLIGNKGVFYFLGSGDEVYEQQIAEIGARSPNFIFLRGYAEELSNALYRAGDLFLMPSSFEPCGISQMLAMRAGQPCVVHGVGGLVDTVENDVSGFVFNGETAMEQAEAFVESVNRGLQMREQNADDWLKMRRTASSKRFEWSTSAKKYIELMYEVA